MKRFCTLAITLAMLVVGCLIPDSVGAITFTTVPLEMNVEQFVSLYNNGIKGLMALDVDNRTGSGNAFILSANEKDNIGIQFITEDGDGKGRIQKIVVILGTYSFDYYEYYISIVQRCAAIAFGSGVDPISGGIGDDFDISGKVLSTISGTITDASKNETEGTGDYAYGDILFEYIYKIDQTRMFLMMRFEQ
jgi:hypothetical protein